MFSHTEATLQENKRGGATGREKSWSWEAEIMKLSQLVSNKPKIIPSAKPQVAEQEYGCAWQCTNTLP